LSIKDTRQPFVTIKVCYQFISELLLVISPTRWPTTGYNTIQTTNLAASTCPEEDKESEGNIPKDSKKYDIVIKLFMIIKLAEVAFLE
jgi:hypothetical protein